MKTSFRITALFLIMSCALSTATVQAAQYYVVIGSFEDESNARKFTGAVRQSFHDVSYTFNQSKKLYYVHVLRTSRKEEARKWSLYLRRSRLPQPITRGRGFKALLRRPSMHPCPPQRHQNYQCGKNRCRNHSRKNCHRRYMRMPRR